MSISGISSNSIMYNPFQASNLFSNIQQSSNFEFSPTDASDENNSKTVNNDLSVLLKALESGNLSDAQTSYSQLVQDLQGTESTDSSSSSSASTSGTGTDSNPLAKDLSDLDDAISSGDLSGAQSILANIMQHMQGPPPPPPDMNTSTDNSTTATDSTSTSNTLAEDLKALQEALSSGDQTSAASYFSQLLQDLNSTGSTDSSNSSSASTSGTGTDSNPLAKDLSDLDDAISSGDLSGAQSILANITQHMQGPPPPPPDMNTSTDNSTTATDSTSTANTLADDLKALGEALSSGDQASATSYFSQILQDLNSTGSTDSSSTESASTGTTSSQYNMLLQNFLQILTSLTGSNSQAGTTDTVA